MRQSKGKGKKAHSEKEQKRVLIIEDIDRDAEILNLMLKSDRFFPEYSIEVERASDIETLDSALTQPTPFDLYLLDIYLPKDSNDKTVQNRGNEALCKILELSKTQSRFKLLKKFGKVILVSTERIKRPTVILQSVNGGDALRFFEQVDELKPSGKEYLYELHFFKKPIDLVDLMHAIKQVWQKE